MTQELLPNMLLSLNTVPGLLALIVPALSSLSKKDLGEDVALVFFFGWYL